MKKIAILTLLTSAMLPLASSAQERANVLNLADARNLFGAMDTDNNQTLTQREAQANGMTQAQVTSYDFNNDGVLSQPEFIIAFTKIAEARGSQVARDLATKVSEIKEERRKAAKDDLSKREAGKKREEAAEAKKVAEARAAGKKREEAAEAKKVAEARAAGKKREEAAKAKKIAEARSAAKRRQQIADAARRRAEAERKKQKRPQGAPKVLHRRIG